MRLRGKHWIKAGIVLAACVCAGIGPAKAAEPAPAMEAVPEWLYASYSFGTNTEDDTIIGGMRLYKGENVVYPTAPTEENGGCSYRIDGVDNDASMCRTVKGDRACAAAVRHYCPGRPEGKRVVSGYIYFDAGRNFTPADRELTFEIEYFDEGTDSFQLMYVNGEETVDTVEVERTDTKTWKVKSFTVRDAYFNGEVPTPLGDGSCDFRIECRGTDTAIGKVSLYNDADSVSGRSYQAVSLGGVPTARSYFTQNMWSADSRQICLYGADGWVYAYHIADGTVRKIARTGSDFYVSKGNYFYYINTAAKTINRISLDTYQEEVLTAYPPGIYGNPSYIHVNNADTKLTVMFAENASPLDLELGEAGTLERRNRRLPVYDIPSGTWDLRYTHEFPAGTPHMTHLMINPEYDNLVFFCHEGTTTKIPDRMWTLNTETGAQKNIFVQQANSVDADSAVKTGETSGHENWTADGEHMVFVKYPYATNVGMNGIVRIDKYGENREYINDDYRYWHCHPSPDNRFVTADTMMTNTAAGQNINMSVGNCDIALVDSKTSSSVLLAHIRAGSVHPYQPHPAFSPDGRLVAFARVNEDELLQVGIMDITDLTAGKPGETFQGRTNEDAGVLVSEPDISSGGVSVDYQGTAETALTLYGAEYDGALLSDVKTAEAKISAGSSGSLWLGGLAEHASVFLWKDDMIPLSFQPSAPEKLRVIQNSSSGVVLGWFPPVNLLSEGIEYEVWRNDEKIGQVSDGYFKDVSAVPDTRCVYRVRAVYPRGTVSPFAETAVTSVSGEMYFVLAHGGERQGLAFLDNSTNPGGDSYTEPAEIGGRQCRKSTSQTVDGKTKTGKFYFACDAGYVDPTDHEIMFTVTYYDNGTAPVYMEYNAMDGTVAKRVPLANRTNTEEWVTASVTVHDAAFTHAAALSYCDFRIEGGPDTYIYAMRAENKTVKSMNALQKSFCLLGETVSGSGLHFYKEGTGDSAFSAGEKGGKACVTIESGKYLYFDVDDAFLCGDAKHGVSIEITYFDEGAGDIMLQYNSNDPTYTGARAYKKCLFGKKTDSRTWKTEKILLVDTSFQNAQDAPYLSDFRIFASDGLSAAKVKVAARP